MLQMLLMLLLMISCLYHRHHLLAPTTTMALTLTGGTSDVSMVGDMFGHSMNNKYYSLIDH
jgi:hypothetical protein